MTTTTNRHSRQRVIQSTESDIETQQPRSISVVIPTYNERENIVPLIERCRDSLEKYDFEIIVVDDNSPDKTWQVARQLFRNTEDVHVVRRRDAADLSTAVSRGFRESSKDACAVIDADFQHPPEKIPALFEALRDGADIAIGSRYVDGAGIENWSRFRHLVSKGATLVAQGGIPTTRRLSDPMSGFFAVQKQFLENVELEPKGYKILLEVLVKCDWEEVTEVPYVFAERDQGDSNLTASEYLRFLEHSLSLGVISRNWEHVIAPSRAVRIVEFALVGGVGAGINMLVFVTAYSFLRTGYLLAGTVAFLFAVNWNFVGNCFFTFDHPDGNLLDQYLTFHAVSLGGFVIYVAALALTIDVLALPALIANTIALGAGAAFNFLGAENVAFASSPPSLSGLLPGTSNSKSANTAENDSGFKTRFQLRAQEEDQTNRTRACYEGESNSRLTSERYVEIADKLEKDDE